MDSEPLKARHRAEREGWPPNLTLRVHRALSWLRGAERLVQQNDIDGQFIYLWIAFNAAYATDIEEKYRESEQQTFRGFVETLRNQLVHGGATLGGSVNREQLRDCTNLMAKLVPLVIEVMMDHPETLWGDACYPVVK